jgi:hypothetical protein
MIRNFAAINEYNKVVSVITGETLEAIQSMFPDVKWVETYANLEGKTLAGVGYKYDETVDDFIGPKYIIDWDAHESCTCNKVFNHLILDTNWDK